MLGFNDLHWCLMPVRIHVRAFRSDISQYGSFRHVRTRSCLGQRRRKLIERRDCLYGLNAGAESFVLLHSSLPPSRRLSASALTQRIPAYIKHGRFSAVKQNSDYYRPRSIASLARRSASLFFSRGMCVKRMFGKCATRRLCTRINCGKSVGSLI